MLTHYKSHSRSPRALRGVVFCWMLSFFVPCALLAQPEGLYTFGEGGSPDGQFLISRGDSNLNLDFFRVNPAGACAGSQPLELGGNGDYWCEPIGGFFDCGPAIAALPRNEHRVLDRINLLPQTDGSFTVFFDTLCGDGSEPAMVDNGQATARKLACTPDDKTLCLNDGRFKVDVTWQNQFSGGLQDAQVGPGFGDGDSGAFFFVDPNNIEVLVKVLDACSFTPHYWVFAAAATDVEYTLTVTDTETSQMRVYTNPLGQPAAAVTDTQAFATCP